MKRSSVIIALEICAIAALFVSWSFQRPNSRQVTVGNASEHFIRWVDFDVTADAMTQAFRYDVDTCQQDLHLNWVDLLAYLGARYGGDFALSGVRYDGSCRTAPKWRYSGRIDEKYDLFCLLS